MTGSPQRRPQQTDLDIDHQGDLIEIKRAGGEALHQIDASDGRIDEAEWRAIVEAWQMDRQEVLEETEDSLRNFILKDVALRNQAFVEHSQTYIGRKITMQDVQRQLILAGFPLPREGADGGFGPETFRALIQFQAAHGRIGPSGSLDPLTLQALFPGGRSVAPRTRAGETPLVPTESADAHESIERVEVVISRAQALEMIRQRNPKTHTPEGALIVYKIDPSSFTQSARYRSNADPSYNGEQGYGTDARDRNLGPEGKEFIAIHGTASDYEDPSMSRQTMDSSGLNTMLDNGLFPYFVSSKGLVFQGASDLHTGSCVNTSIANPNMANYRYENFSNKGIAIEFSLRSAGGGGVEDPNSAQVRAGRDLIALLASEHRIPMTNVITSADPVRDLSTGQLLPGDTHGDDFKDQFATQMGLMTQAERHARLRSGRFFQYETTSQTLQTFTRAQHQELGRIYNRLSQQGRRRYEEYYAYTGSYPDKYQGFDMRYGLQGSGLERLPMKHSNRVLIVDSFNDQAAVYEKRDGLLHLVRTFPMIGGRNTDANFDKSKQGDKTSVLGIYELTRKTSRSKYFRDRETGKKLYTFNIDVPSHIGTAMDIHPPQYASIADGDPEDRQVRSGNDISSGCYVPTHDDYYWLQNEGMPKGGMIVAVPTVYGDFPQVIGGERKAFEQIENPNELTPHQLFSMTVELVRQNDTTEEIKGLISRLSGPQKEAYNQFLMGKITYHSLPDRAGETHVFQQFAHLHGVPINHIDDRYGVETEYIFFNWFLATLGKNGIHHTLNPKFDSQGNPINEAAPQNDPDLRDVSRRILRWEARKYDGAIAAYTLPDGDQQRVTTGEMINTYTVVNGKLKQKRIDKGHFEFGGFGWKYNPEAFNIMLQVWNRFCQASGSRRDALKRELEETYIGLLIEKGDRSTPAGIQHPGMVLAFRETAFNRGSTGLKTMIRMTLNDMEPGRFGSVLSGGRTRDNLNGKGRPDLTAQELAALNQIATDHNLYRLFIENLYKNREVYEDIYYGARPQFRRGLQNRWSDMKEAALSYARVDTNEPLREGTLRWNEAYRRLSPNFRIYSSSQEYAENGQSRASNRTCLDGLQSTTILGAERLKRALEQKFGEDPKLVITGGTEDNHSTNGEYTHWNGYKLDFRDCEELREFTGLSVAGTSKTMTVEGQRMKFYYHTGTGIHFDVTFYPN